MRIEVLYLVPFLFALLPLVDTRYFLLLLSKKLNGTQSSNKWSWLQTVHGVDQGCPMGGLPACLMWPALKSKWTRNDILV